MLVVNAGVVKLAVFAPPVNGVVVVLLAYQLNTGLVTPLAVAVKVAVKPLQILVPGAVIVATTAREFTVTVTALRVLVAFSQWLVPLTET